MSTSASSRIPVVKHLIFYSIEWIDQICMFIAVSKDLISYQIAFRPFSEQITVWRYRSKFLIEIMVAQCISNAQLPPVVLLLVEFSSKFYMGFIIKQWHFWPWNNIAEVEEKMVDVFNDTNCLCARLWVWNSIEVSYKTRGVSEFYRCNCTTTIYSPDF